MDQYKEFDIIHNGRRFPLVDNMTTFDLCESRDTVECKCECAAEDIADNAGVKLAYRIYQRLQYRAKVDCIPGMPFTQNQLFWVTDKIFLILNQCFPAWLRHGLVCGGRGLFLRADPDPRCGESRPHLAAAVT